MVGIRFYLFVLVGKSYIRESRSIVGISHLHSLCLDIGVNFSLKSSVTSRVRVTTSKCMLGNEGTGACLICIFHMRHVCIKKFIHIF